MYVPLLLIWKSFCFIIIYHIWYVVDIYICYVCIFYSKEPYVFPIKKTLFLQIFGLVAFIKQLCLIKATRPKIMLDKGHEAENLQKECLFLLYYHFPMDDSSDSYVFKPLLWFASSSYAIISVQMSQVFHSVCLALEAKSRKYQGVFEVKSRVKTWQVRGIRSQQLEH